MNRLIKQIRSLKFDGTLHRSWEAELIQRKGSLMIFRGLFEKDVSHPDLGKISCGTESFEYYWTDRWYNIFRFNNPDGTFRNFYCNINMPPVVRGDSLEFVDLDLDLLVRKNCTPKILDRDEFESNATSYEYGAEIRTRALLQLDILFEMIENREFPFDTADY